MEKVDELEKQSASDVLESNTRKESLGRKIVMFPLTRILIGAFVVLGVTGLIQWVLVLLRKALSVPNSDGYRFIVTLAAAVATFIAYFFFVRIVERRKPTELALKGAPGELGAGLLLGTFILSLVVGIMAMAGAYRIVGTNSLTALLPMIAISIISSVVEEILLRGILFRITEESLGTTIALVISSLIFGFLHFANPGATLFSSIAIALEAGLLLGMTFVLTRRIWLSIGVHAAWNFTQGGIFGVAVSGNQVKGLFVPSIHGPEWLTGGAFGAEASVEAVLVCLTLFALLTLLAAKRSGFIAPFWKRRKAIGSAPKAA